MGRKTARAICLVSIVLAAGCTSTESTLDPAAIAPAEKPDTLPPAMTTTGAAAVPAPAQPAPPPPTVENAALVASARVHFAPIVGATVSAVGPLNQRISDRARERGLRLVPSGDAGTTHIVKGYFSAINEGKESSVIFVWDVVDPSGNRVHRIQGQERAPGTGGEGWAGVAPQTMEAVANRTIDELIGWLGSRSG